MGIISSKVNDIVLVDRGTHKCQVVISIGSVTSVTNTLANNRQESISKK